MITVALFVLIYRFMPKAAVTLRDTLPGAFLAGLLWEIAKYIFALSLHYFHYDQVYGSVGAVVAVLTWSYVSSLILLFGAQLTAVFHYEHPPATDKRRMKIADFDYELPAELIAQAPLEERDASRMLVLDRSEQTWIDSRFKEFTGYLRPNDVVVVNNSRVIPARLLGHREESGGQVEIFLVREIEPEIWEALVRPGGRLKKGSRAIFGEGRLIAELLDEPGPELRPVRFYCEGPFHDALAEIGSTPLPPYIKRPSGVSSEDRERYQTVYSQTARRDRSADRRSAFHT